MTMPSAERGAFERIGPTDQGFHCGTLAAVTATAAIVDLNGSWGGTAVDGVTVNRLKTGGAWVSMQARGGTATLRNVYPLNFTPGSPPVKPPTAPTAATTAGNSGNGETLADGAIEEFWIPSSRPYIDVIGSTTMKLFVWFSSRNDANQVQP